ncbi:MAG: hypothetical protein HY272_02920 [Gammaproteobacteria bacterium]|nr:hypothetical protein [Gammaproteobacteria bacterium]
MLFRLNLSHITKLALPLAMVAITAGCAHKPTLSALDPVSGERGTIVEVIGQDLFASSVRWDANTANEQTLPSNFLGARFFSVPYTASLAAHPVRLYGDNQYSDNTINFTVTQGVAHPAPRVDDITVSMFSIDTNNKATMILMVHGANIDAGATILVNNVDQTSFFSRLLRNQAMNATDAATLGYPIFHYATVWCILSDQAPNSDLSVSVRNLNGSASNNLNYHIAASMAALDSDGDGLLDDWETNGYDANNDGTIDVDLPTLGANPMRKDLFVEVDWMNAAAPNNAIWADIETAFANAPILNSDGSQGIAIHIDRGVGTGGGGGTIIPYADAIRYDNSTPNRNLTYANFHTIKQNNFNANRLNIYRYGIFAWDNGHWVGSSGQAEDIWANDFFVSLGSWGADGQRTDFQVGTFMHELGHTLNLRHGGFEDTNSKDNYNSIMQYGNNWTTVAGQNNKFSPSQFSGIDTDCNLLNVNGEFTYSQGQRRDLDENSLNENSGICDNIARDWNGNGAMQANVSTNIDDNAALSTIRDHADWANIELNFRATGSNWGNN